MHVELTEPTIYAVGEATIEFIGILSFMNRILVPATNKGLFSEKVNVSTP